MCTVCLRSSRGQRGQSSVWEREWQGGRQRDDKTVVWAVKDIALNMSEHDDNMMSKPHGSFQWNWGAIMLSN